MTDLARQSPRTLKSDADSSVMSRRRPELLAFLEKYALAVLLALLCLFFSVYGSTAETFPSLANIRNIFGDHLTMPQAVDKK